MQEQVVERFATDPLLKDFVVPFPNLLRDNSVDIENSFVRIKELLGNGYKAAVAQFTLSKGNVSRSWCLILSPGSCKLSEDSYLHPDLEILTNEIVWSEIAQGKISPLEAFGQGKLRVRGNIVLARHIVKILREQSK